jgi:glycosyltransferase involved in cell wall biosynthesis
MVPPLISYIVFHRLGLTVQNLSEILNSKEDFELHIVDSNSSDGTWDYLMSLSDQRIKSVERFEINLAD